LTSAVTIVLTLFLPANKISNAMAAVIAISNDVGKLPFVCTRPTPAEIKPPTPNCIKPSKAAALPAFFLKGDNATAAAFGYVKPAHDKIIKRKIMFVANPYHAFITPIKYKALAIV